MRSEDFTLPPFPIVPSDLPSEFDGVAIQWRLQWAVLLPAGFKKPADGTFSYYDLKNPGVEYITDRRVERVYAWSEEEAYSAMLQKTWSWRRDVLFEECKFVIESLWSFDMEGELYPQPED